VEELAMHQLRWGVGLMLVGCAATAPKAAPTTPVAQAAPEEREESVGAVHERGGDKLTVDVGGQGGTLELDNGARLEIPRGALTEVTEVTFSRGTKTTAFANHEWERPLGPTLEVSPGVPLGTPVRISVPVSNLPEGFTADDLALGLEVPADQQRGAEMTGTVTRWSYIPATSTSGRFVAELDQLPGYRLQFVVSKNE
jgi:hypothetical protein